MAEDRSGGTPSPTAQRRPGPRGARSSWGRAGRLALTTLALSGCAGWRSYRPSDDPAPLPGVLRLTLQGDSLVVLHDAALEGDSVYVGRDGERPDSILRIPVDRVEGLEVPGDSQAVEVISGAVGLALGGALLVWVFGLLGV